MKTKTLLPLLLALSPSLAFAHNLSVGETVPPAQVGAYGEIVLQGEGVAYQPWATQHMLGKVRVIQAIAGRSSSKEMNAPLMTAITAAKFPEDSYQTTTIINQDDAIWGTGSFVKSSAQDSKKEFPWSSMVLDENGLVANTWGLKEESSAIIVQDKQGKVLFVKEGALTQDEITQVISLIKQSI
ncbi:YtfJ family protein [Vibrio parahaemolyticus]|uniref:YtfJ family protein n=1 Tax=Vibrio parahaemolyticus TaxID=670 RepID=UPI00084B8F48|nr:YtfJ family protein [Vibrio parahaemolyticus]EGR1343107.1 YtfJ family protein [Vibrio parahaemolyticus]EIC2573656.1 YtfJ family protein [Vibrio parahaemolyticus]EID0038084.1 YtfJ family protein [Vibrio parahaemolyticus]EJC7014888.1 YtfJ family protein [Vibrio parahaemolyticus]ELA9361159.1 YtfJ family protein [Vibrio parahaemolyticus]